MSVFQGEIFFAELDPTKGQEQAGLRPVVIVSGNAFNSNRNICIICPVTSRIKNYYGDVILQPSKLNGLKDTSEVLGFQIRTISTERLTKKIGQITPEEIEKVVQGIGLVLRY